MRVLVTGWSSFQDGEATGGDVLSMETVRDSLVEAGIAVDVAWSPGLRADGLRLEGTDPNAYTHLLFVCGPAHGLQVRQLHERFAHCRRVAVGESRLWCPTILPSPDSMRSSRATGQVSVRTVIWRLAHAVRTRTRVAARGMPPVAPSLRCCSNPLRKSDLERLLLRLRDPCAVASIRHHRGG